MIDELDDQILSLMRQVVDRAPSPPDLTATEATFVNVAQLGDITGHATTGATVRPTADGTRYQRRLLPPITVAALLLAALGLGWIATRDTEQAEPGFQISDAIAAGLLFPQTTPHANIEASLGPDQPSMGIGLIRSPGGGLFQISVSTFVKEAMPQGSDRKQVNGRTFAVSDDQPDQFINTLTYTYTDPCIGIAVSESDLNATAWDNNAVSALTALSIDRANATVSLPTGWDTLGSGQPGTRIQLDYRTTVGGVTHDVVLQQMPNTPVAALMLGPLTPTTFNGLPAWIIETDPVISLIWNDDGNAVSLSSIHATADDLKQVAAGLRHDHAADWARYLENATYEPGAHRNPTSADASSACGTPTLSIIDPNDNETHTDPGSDTTPT